MEFAGRDGTQVEALGLGLHQPLGLTSADVERRRAAGQANPPAPPTTQPASVLIVVGALVVWAVALTSSWRWRLLERYLDLPM